MGLFDGLFSGISKGWNDLWGLPSGAGYGIGSFLDRSLKGINPWDDKANAEYINNRQSGKQAAGFFEDNGSNILGYGALIAAPWLLGGGSYAAGLGKIGAGLGKAASAAWNYGGKQALTAAGTSALSGGAPQQPTGGGLDYDALAKQMAANQAKQQQSYYRSQPGMRYGGAYGRW